MTQMMDCAVPARGGVVRPVQARVGVAGVMRGVGQALVSGVRLGAMSGLQACAPVLRFVCYSCRWN